MGGFTRILHSGEADDLMDEVPTVVVDKLPESALKNSSYVVLNRPCAWGIGTRIGQDRVKRRQVGVAGTECPAWASSPLDPSQYNCQQAASLPHPCCFKPGRRCWERVSTCWLSGARVAAALTCLLPLLVCCCLRCIQTLFFSG